ncbi:hypothetical protein PUN4_450018 [Paraburkholderia unamae]|jgi:hypothetical protein|uniref:hypothetical protein n=1 Tax=Paraburkholderia unamae TaxID=219649 RepID=UPI001CAE88AB|nr:hypothetical protein [Paraburkholderia unamae]CAG9263815.1 hypothetical protein PUN4_450018 [Paraburkholderia unamae]
MLEVGVATIFTAITLAIGGATWAALNAGTERSISGHIAHGNGLLGVGLDGLALKHGAGGKWLKVQQREDRSALTAATVGKTGNPVRFSQDGVLVGP